MINLLKSSTKAAAVIVDLPVAIVADVISLGGVLSDKDSTYTSDACSRFVKNTKDITDPDK